jgi:putative endonuclease
VLQKYLHIDAICACLARPDRLASPDMTTDLRHHLGRLGEHLASEHLERLGYAILTRNYRTRWGEIDVVACDGARILFCEVRTRRTGSSGPFDGLRAAQCRRLRRTAVTWLQEQEQRPHVSELRFDAIGVTIDPTGQLVALEHLEGAF